MEKRKSIAGEGCVKAIHYWTGRGTLCSLDNSRKQKPNHVTTWAAVNCKYCIYCKVQSEKGRAEDAKR